MSKEKARERIKEIEKEQRKIHRVSWPVYLALLAILIGRMFIDSEDLPTFIQNENLLYAVTLVLFIAGVWIVVKSRKCSRERDEILAKYGIW